jgi:hypothetical protein
MFIDRKIREELNALSKEIFRVSSKWQSLLEHGENILVTETKTETVPGENGAPDTTEEVQVPVLKNGMKQYTHVTYTLEEVHQRLLKIKKNRDEYIAKIREAQAKKELEKRVNDEAQGRVVG